ncbi:HAMP domain-containing sensor histidine kinase [Simiduia curdlanivorans]|uniref:histidine kinase n=1 Tax=Simiduia curdlanivorans TaxID=1492769 RepID=A0ABV8V118_9GAMM|nr:HAMP domain-containing sensor histidine kinase [Simiduia curdlanivorans]MDN3640474.1 HAMP domain-containing sensor histidine kinase [Simiduia curdlanivorans]
MNWRAWSLRSRLSVSFILLFCLIGLSYVSLIFWSSDRYYDEITQKLNRSLAMYIVNRAPLIEQGVVNEAAMQELAGLVMVVNPIVEVYLLDADGRILSQGVPADSVKRAQVALPPLLHWLAEPDAATVLGTDPRSVTGEKIFSVFPVGSAQEPEGYLYVILGGERYNTLGDSLKGSYSLQLAAGAIFALLSFAVAVGFLMFSSLTKPLRKLSLDMHKFARAQQLVPASSENTLALGRDEIAHMSQAFHAMQSRIEAQMHSLEETDRLRRELISNVSHDLRTPLASMQGYLEVLSLPGQKLTEAERSRYLSTAYKHCQGLGRLISELFELSKLDAGRVAPKLERFSLAELLQDVMQKFELKAKDRTVELVFQVDGGLFQVDADIALIERVLENLVDNALRYTPAGGRVTLGLKSGVADIQVSVADTGVGVSEEELPKLFDRYYRVARSNVESDQGTGLGLAIVKRILDLHGCNIQVTSRLGQGSCFAFMLHAA